MSDQPIFDDSRKALVFALNAIDVSMPRPAMTKAMASGIKAKPARKRKLKKGEFLPEVDLLAEADAQAREASRIVRAAFRRRTERLTPLEEAAQAGFILQEFAKMEATHQMVLRGLLMRSHTPCSCRRPCCSGWAQNLSWSKAVADTCLALKEGGEVIKSPGKRGLSTQPALRRAIVEQFFTKAEVSLVSLATLGEVSLQTAAKHRGWIIEYLEQTETEAWLQIDALLDKAGITGAFTD